MNFRIVHHWTSPRVFSMLGGLMLVLGCGKSDRSADSSVAAAPTSRAATKTCAPQEMAYSYDDTKNDAARVKALHDDYLPKLDFGDGKANKRPRKCKAGTGNCSTSKPTIDVTIAPEHCVKDLGTVDQTTEEITLDGASATSSHSYIIAHLTNNGDAEEDWLGLPATQDVYELVEPDPTGGTRARFIQIYQDGNVSKTKELNEAIRPHFLGCGHVNNKNLEADFGGCKEHPADQSVARATHAPPIDPAVDVTSTWISCVAGCCTADAGTKGGQSRSR